jgi:hypothetical protein
MEHRNTMRSLIRFLILLAVLGAPVAAMAHHSFVVAFLPDKIIKVTGVVSEFRFSNPHGIVHFTVKTPEGMVEEWKAETNSPNVLRRRGWSHDSIKVGDVITVTGWPARDGSNLIRVNKIDLPSGKTLIGQGITPNAANDKE